MMRIFFVVAFSVLYLAAPTEGQEQDFRQLRLSLDQVTDPDIALFPDDGGVLFTLLGHLYRIPPEGGEAEPLTAGPFYHKEPAISPDGRKIAFVSDRGGDGDNLFVLDLGSGEVVRLTSESEAGRPAWSPDGTRIAYLAYERPRLIEPWLSHERQQGPGSWVRVVDVSSGTIVGITTSPESIRAVEYGRDGLLHWVRVEPEGRCWGCARSLVERQLDAGEHDLLLSIEGVVDQVVFDSASGALFYRGTRQGSRDRVVYRMGQEGEETRVFDGDIDPQFYRAPRFAVSPGGAEVYAGDWGRLWRASAETGERYPIPFHAEVTQTVAVAPAPPPWPAREDSGTFPVSIVGDPAVSPSGSEVMFSAAGMIWRRSLESLDAQPELVDSGPAWDPAYAPDGRFAYVRAGVETGGELVVVGADGTPSVVARGRISNPVWSPDGEEVVFARSWDLVGVTPTQGTERVVAPGDGAWDRPSLAGDGSWVAGYLAKPNSQDAMVWFPAGNPQSASRLTDMREQGKAGLISPDGRWLGFQRNADLWVADLSEALADDSLVTEDEVRLFAAGGGLGFSFHPAGDALVFTRADRIFMASLPDGVPEEISGPFQVPRADRATLVVRNVRLLAPHGQSFAEKQDVFIEQGGITGLGEPPPGFDQALAEVVDAEGRFAVPGLWDSHLHGMWIDDSGRGVRPSDRLRFGVTSTRDPGSPIVAAIQAVDRTRAASIAAPRRFTSGEIFEGMLDNWWGQWHRIGSAADAVHNVREWKDLGARFIKIYRSVPWRLQRVLAAEASAQGLPVMGHGMTAEEVVRSVTLGYRSLEHGSYPAVWHEDIFRLMAAAGVYWSPQYVLSSFLPVFARQDPSKLERILEALDLQETVGPVRHGNESTGSILGMWQLHGSQLRTAHQLGVRLVLGTDNALGPGSLHLEIEIFRDFGIPEADILRMATVRAAEAEGVDHVLGTLEVGKLADLLLLDGNPLEDIGNLRRPRLVILDGRVVHRRTER
jgi:imidazolonepropionase-like amidohydrolase